MNIITIMNFVRGCEPRNPALDLFEAPYNQNKLNKKYGFPNTFLLQYDAMILPKFTEFFKEAEDDLTELGLWVEIVRPLTEKVGIEWRGRPGWDWDWYINPGFLPAYTKEQKELLIDELMRKFKEIFGHYPKTVASWVLDAYSLNYINEKYEVSAFAICREQHSVDAYTLWGGPNNQPYYPSKTNMLCPAQRSETMINTPMFRLLGTDPIRAYWPERYADSSGCHGCPTMEPVWSYGQNKEYMEWFFKTYFENENMGIGYTQIGQENSFGWPAMKKGTELQYDLVDKYAKDGKAVLMTMSQAGEYFKKNYPDTPPQALIANSDACEDDFYRTAWFSNKYYRANIFINRGRLMFRDIQKFDDRYSERYVDEPCLGWDAVYDNLPVVDELIRAKSVEKPDSGIFFEGNYTMEDAKAEGDTLRVVFKRDDGEIVTVIFEEKAIKINCKCPITWKFGTFHDYKICDDKLCLSHNSFDYSVSLTGDITTTEEGFILSGKQRKSNLYSFYGSIKISIVTADT